MLRVQFLGPLCQPTGYGRAFHDYLLALYPRNDLDFKVAPTAVAPKAFLEPRYQAILGREGGYNGDDGDEMPHVCVAHCPPGPAPDLVRGEMEPPKECARVLITTWESDSFPADMAEALADAYDIVIVPCEFNYHVMRFAHPKLAPKLRVVPHGFDSEFWRRPETEGLKSDRFKDDTRFSFYTVGSWVERKNPVGLLKAYLTAFTSKDDVVLRMLTPAVNEQDVQALARAINLPDLPPVEFYGREAGKQRHNNQGTFGRFSEDDLLALHYRSKVYVTLTRGEGWNLGAFEAAVVGNPVIATNFSGQLDYLKEYVGYFPVPYMSTPCIVPESLAGREMTVGGIRVSAMARVSPPGINGLQCWAEPDLISARNQMRRLYKSRQDYQRYPDQLGAFEYKKVSDLLFSALQQAVEARHGR